MLSTRAHSPAVLLMALFAIAAPGRAQTLAITGGTIIDGTGKAPLSDGVVLITGGRLAAVGGSRDVVIPRAARKLDARGKYVIPGLMDANLHLGGAVAIGLEALINYDDRYEQIILEAAQIALKTGQTTVFDTWGPRAALVKVRDLINAGGAPGSRIYLAGNIIGMDGPLSADFPVVGEGAAQHVSKAFVNRVNEAWEQGTGRKLLWLTLEEVRAVIREYARKDVDFLKYLANDHGHGGNFIAFSPRIQRVIVEEGRRAGLTIQTHTASVEGLEVAIEAGVDIVTHGELTGPISIPEETIRKLVERRIAVGVLPQTQRHLEALEKHNPALTDLTTMWKVAKTNRRNMIKAGVTMLMTTDAVTWDPVLFANLPLPVPDDTVDPQSKLGEGHFNALAALEEEGMAPMEILRSATSHIARAYKLDGKLGTLEPGKIADLVILDANPLESARNYRRIHTVIKDGKVVDRDALPVAPILSARATRN